MMYKDYGILILKPDGVKKNLELICEKEFKDRKINIISKTKRKLEKSELAGNFYYSFDEYVEYMCSDEICAYLLEGINIDMDEELFLVKNKIRKSLDVDGTIMKNYVHGSHCGTEYFLQRKLLFSQYENYKFSAYADMYSRIHEISDSTISRIADILRVSNVKRINLDIPYEVYNKATEYIQSKLNSKYVSYSFTQQICIDGKVCSLINYFPYGFEVDNSNNDMNYLYMKSSKVFLGIFDCVNYYEKIDCDTTTVKDFAKKCEVYINAQIENMIIKIRKIGINLSGILINTARMSLLEAECRYEVAKKMNLLCAGGSDNVENIGLFGMSLNKYKPLSDELGWK